MSATRRVNVRFLGVLVGTLAVLGPSIYFVNAYQVQRNADAWKHRASQAFDEGHYDQAAKYFNLYLLQHPDDIDARIGRAQALDKKSPNSLGDRKEAFENFEYVLRWQPSHDDIRRRQVDQALSIGERDVAMAHIQKLLGGNRANDGELEQLLALCYAVGNDDLQAVTHYEKAIQDAPHHLASYVQLANLYLTRRKEPAKANEVMKQMLTENGEKWEAHLAAAAILRYQGESEDEEVKKALELAPDKAETILEAAASAARQHRLDEARALLERGLGRYPKNAEMYYRLARVEMDAGHVDKAEEHLRRGLREVSDQAQNSLLHLLALVLIQRGDIAQAEKQIDNLRSRGASEIYVDDLKARVHMHKEEWSAASLLLERLRHLVRQQPDFAFQVQLFLGRCYEHLREPDLALESYEEALRLRPDSPDSLRARRGKASSLLALGRADEALVEFRQILPKDPSAALPLARLLADRQLKLALNQRTWKDVDEALRRAPDSPELSIFKAELARIRSNSKEGLDLLQKERDKDPAQPAPWIAMIQMAQNEGNQAQALTLINEAETKLGDRVDLRLARARHMFGIGGEAAAAALIKLEDNTGKFTPADRAALLAGLADLYIRTGNGQQAKRLWTQLARMQPKNLQVRMALFELAFLTGSEEELDPLLREIRTIEGDEGTLWRYCQACRVILAVRKAKPNRENLTEAERQKLTDARTLLASVASQRPKWSRVALRQAELAELEGDSKAAIELYQRALSLGERDPASFRPAVYLLFQNRSLLEAENMLATLQVQTPNLPDDLRQLRILILGQLGNHQAAADLAAKALEAGSKNPADHYWYAQALALQGKTEEAEKAYRAALQLPGIDKMPNIWVQFVLFLVRTNQRSKAVAVVQEAEKKVPAEKASFILAECYEALNEPGRVEEQYLNVLRKNADDRDALRGIVNFYDRHEQLPRAEPYLRKLLDPRTKATPAEVQTARRGLAILLASKGDYEKFQEGRDILMQNAKNGELPVPDQHALAKIYAKHTYHWREAMDLFEKLQGQPGELPLDEQLELARLYEHYGPNEWAKARQIYLKLLPAYADNPAIIYLCARNLLRHGEPEGVANWLARLEKLDGPQSLRVLEVRVRLLKEQGKLEEGAKYLKDYAESRDAKEENLHTAAALLEEFGKPRDAEEIYRKLVAKPGRPENILLLAAFLGRQGRPADIQEAVKLCDEAWKSCPPENVAFVAIAILNGIKTQNDTLMKEAYALVERGLTEALRKSPKSLALLFYMAGLRSLEQKYGEAETAYRQILQQDPRNALARNNLAWLLAARDGKAKATQALDLINQAIQSVGPSAELLDTRAFIHLKMEHAEEALKDLQRALDEEKQKPNPSAVMYFHLALAQEMLKDPSAVDSLRMAQKYKLKVHPLEQQAYDQLIKVLRPT